MHHQSKERKMSKSQKKKNNNNNRQKKKLTRAFPFGLARFRFNEVRINEVPLYQINRLSAVDANWRHPRGCD